MSGFTWLNDLMVWLGKWFPRLVLVKSTEKGVLFSPGGRTRLIDPGLLLFWPIIQELRKTPTTQRTLEISAQIVGRQSVGINVFWRVVDVHTALTQVHQLPSNLDDHGQAALSESCPSDNCELSNAALAEAIRDNLRTRLTKFGYEISAVGIVNRGRVLSLRHLNDWATHETNEHNPYDGMDRD